jgi:hypothetical protein
MKDQHKKITGYRDLSEEEIALMNEVKALSETVGALIANLEGAGDMTLVDPAKLDQRWVAIAKTHLQQGFMAAIRGIAKPETF